MTRFVGAIDQGTTSSRFIVFDRAGAIVARRRRSTGRFSRSPAGWNTTRTKSATTRRRLSSEALRSAGSGRRRPRGGRASPTSVRPRCCGIARPVEPLHNALVWQDTRVEPLVAAFARDGGQDRFRAQTGLPLASYFSALSCAGCSTMCRMRARRAERGDSHSAPSTLWLLWRLTGLHVTDVTNASRTQLMDLATLDWDDAIARARSAFRARCCRASSPSASSMARRAAPLAGVPIAGILGDQQAALMGQACFEPGEAKNTYGTGCFLLMHTGTRRCHRARAW